MQTPWKTDKWFISPWNYLPEVTKDYKFKKDIKIHDVTLRELARLKPRTEYDLQQISGIGEKKAQALGGAVLAVIAEHLKA